MPRKVRGRRLRTNIELDRQRKRADKKGLSSKDNIVLGSSTVTSTADTKAQSSELQSSSSTSDISSNLDVCPIQQFSVPQGYRIPKKPPQPPDQELQLERLLCDIYLKRLKEWQPPSCRELSQSSSLRLPHGTGHFGRRHVWLDDMPPFTGTRSIQKTCRYLVPAGHKAGKQSHQLLQCQKTDVVCTCFLCNEDLLKLQSILCSSFTTPHLAEKTLSSLEDQQELASYHSLYILCMVHVNIDTAIGFVTNNFPHILAKLGAAALKDNYTQWDQLLKALLVKIRQTKDTQVYRTTLKEVLSEMAGIFSPEQFLQLLPADGNFYFFMPYIQLSRDRHLCYLLGQKIMSKGDNLEQCL